MRVLVTGGLGFIGSHQVVALADAGHEPLIVDDLSNSDVTVLDRLCRLTARELPFGRFDVRDRDALERFVGSKASRLPSTSQPGPTCGGQWRSPPSTTT